MTPVPRVAVSCVVLTLNEEKNVPAVLSSLGPADQVVVVDSGSTDGTVALASEHGAEVLDTEWRGYARQRNWALVHPAVRNSWVFFVDADEQMSADAWAEVSAFLENPSGHRAADFRRSVRLFGKELKHGGFNSARVTRLLHRDYCKYADRPVHEHAIVSGSTHHMTAPLLHYDHKPFSAWLERHNRYSTLEAQARLHPPQSAPRGSAGVKQWIRTHLWQRLPARPVLLFLYVYVIRLGFLDGQAGLRIAALYGFQELSIQVKLEELRKDGRC